MLTTDKLLLTVPPKMLPIQVTGFTKMLLSNATIAAGQQTRMWPGLDVSKWRRLHFTIGADARGVANLDVRVLFSVPVPGTHCGGILTSSTVWFEDQASLQEFEYTTPANFGSTGFTMSVPVIAPVLYDVILRNTGTSTLDAIYVALFAQEA